MKIGDIAVAVGKEYNTVKQRLWKMREKGEVLSEDGLYKVAPEQRDFDLDAV
jgi:hypothetical protein